MSSHSDSELKIDLKNKPRRNNLHCTFKARDRRYRIHSSNPSSTVHALKKVLREAPSLSVRERRLVTAINTNNTDLVRQLLEADVDPNSMDKQQRSALHLAASKGYADIVRLLLQHGADINAQDIIGNTPLHLATCTSNLAIITMLLNAGANVATLDMHGRNPLQLAESKLQIWRQGWRTGAIEMITLRAQLQLIIDIMITLWRRQEAVRRRSKRENVDDLELMKLHIEATSEEEVDGQMSRILKELQDFTLK